MPSEPPLSGSSGALSVLEYLHGKASPQRRGVWRRRFLLAMVCLTPGVGIAASWGVLAFLKAAPKVTPVEDSPPVSNAGVATELHPARRALERNPIHDETNPDYGRLQRIDDATRGIKRDAAGFPDWMAALRSGAIAPRAGMSAGENMTVMDLNVVMRNTKEMPHVLFPHLAHTVWLDCSNCHPSPFLPSAGANPISMSEIFRGRYCGMCHDRVAFITFFSCERCHSVAQGGSPAQK